MRKGKIILNGVTILDAGYLILFKAKAWLDLTRRKGAGEQVDSKNIRKHKNDVFRLSMLMGEGDRIHILPSVSQDIMEFIKAMRSEEVDLKQLGIMNRSKNEILDSFLNMYFT